MHNVFPSQDIVRLVREMYPPGSPGTVEFVDDTATVFVAWDCGSHLGAVYGEDKIRRI